MTSPNDWQIKKCLVLSLSLLLAMLGLVGLALLGFDIPGLRQLSGFLFLTFIPGILILRILRIHNIGIIESLLYSVGLSLAFAMATGVVANFALPPLGISHPIALAPLTATSTAFFLILCFLAYKRDKDFHLANLLPEDNEKTVKPSFWSKFNPYMLAILLPLLAILGTSLVNAYQNNTLLLILIFVVILIIGLVAFNKFIPPRVYPFMIFMMALALIYQTTLISSYLVGSDIHLECYLGKLIVENGYWDATVPGFLNSCLSILMLAPVYSLLLNMDIIWLYKIIYPLSFCLLPLALFRIFRLQIKPRYAFLAAFFFISMPMFTMDMAQLCRQQISELFFVLVILLMVDRKLTLIQRTTLVLIFGFGVVISHYGMGTGYIGYLIFGALVLVIIRSRQGRTIWQWLIGKSNSLPDDLTSAGAFNKKALAIIVGVSLVFMLGYYSVVASGSALSGIRVATSIVESTTETVTSGSFSFPDPMGEEPLTQTALGLDFPLASPGGKAWRIFQYLVELCLIVGFVRLIFRPGRLGKFKAAYISLTIVSALILLGIFVLPTGSYGMGVTRIFQITLLLMSPLFIFGGEAMGRGIVKLARVFRKGFASLQLTPDSPVPLRFLVLAILIPYFIFNSGAIFELSRSQTTHFINMPYSIALSSYRVDVTTVFTSQDVTAAEWLSRVATDGYLAYVDHHSGKLFANQIDFPCSVTLLQSLITVGSLPTPNTVKELLRDAKGGHSPNYFYLRGWNTQEKALTFGSGYATRLSISFNDFPWFMGAVEKANRIYNNGSAQILLQQQNDKLEKDDET